MIIMSNSNNASLIIQSLYNIGHILSIIGYFPIVTQP